MLYEIENMRMPELKSVARERRLRGYSQFRKAELIAFLQDNAPQALRQQRPPHPNRPPPPPPQMSTWEPIDDKPRQPELEGAPLTKRQLKHREIRILS